MQFFTILLGSGPPCGTKIGEKSVFKLEDLEKRRTLKNTAWASKNQGLASQKTMKNHRRKASDGDSEKKRPRNAKNAIFGAPGARFGSPKRNIFGGFSKVLRSLFCDAMGMARESSEGSGP